LSLTLEIQVYSKFY